LGQSLYEKVNQVIEMIRPAAQADGGDIELVEVTADGEVRVRFLGACATCPSQDLTLQSGIEKNLKTRVPEVTQVVTVD